MKKDKHNNIIIEYYPIILINIGLFRRPEPLIGSLFLPMLILTVMQGIVFFSEGTQNEKLANIATILLAILSYQQVFRASIPVIPDTTLGDKYVYSSLVITVFAAFDAYFNGNKSVNFEENLVRLCLFGTCTLYTLYVLLLTAKKYI